MFAAQDGVTPTSVLYADDVFSTYLYTGDGQLTQTITNGIDLAGKGGMVWGKSRSNALTHHLFDSARGPTKFLVSNNTGAESTSSNLAFSSTGFTAAGDINALNQNFVSWTFRKASKFFDVVTYTGNGTNRDISQSLGGVPGLIIIKATSTTSAWAVWHRYSGNTASVRAFLNTTAAFATDGTYFNPGAGNTATTFNIGTAADVNATGVSYVAYLFAHDTSSTGLIQCGSYTGNGSATGPIVTLGWEPQWLLVKKASGTGNWNIFDSMRGFTVAGQNDAYLEANTTDAEALADWVAPSATGFQITTTSTELNTNTSTYIYIAIRRPNKPPTSGAEVFSPLAGIAGNGIGTLNKYNGSNSPNDMLIMFGSRTAPTTPAWLWADRLRGYPTTGFPILDSTSTAAEATRTSIPYMSIGGGSINYTPSANNLVYRFARAPGFFDEVCYTGTGVARTVAHSLGVVPELVIFKNRSSSGDWPMVATPLGTAAGYYIGAFLNLANSLVYAHCLLVSGTTVSAINIDGEANLSTTTYVAYLFATLPGISKVGTYTGNGTSQTINCGFTTGARFVMIKRTDSTGDWYVYDTERGIVSGGDAILRLNTTGAETTGDDLSPVSSGFGVNQQVAQNINVTSATYIFLAIS